MLRTNIKGQGGTDYVWRLMDYGSRIRDIGISWAFSIVAAAKADSSTKSDFGVAFKRWPIIRQRRKRMKRDGDCAVILARQNAASHWSGSSTIRIRRVDKNAASKKLVPYIGVTIVQYINLIIGLTLSKVSKWLFDLASYWTVKRNTSEQVDLKSTICSPDRHSDRNGATSPLAVWLVCIHA